MNRKCSRRAAGRRQAAGGGRQKAESAEGRRQEAGGRRQKAEGRKLLGQNLVDELDGHGSFAHGGGDTLHAAGADVANREYAGTAGFEKKRRAPQWPVGPKVRTRSDELLGIQCQTSLQPTCIWVGAGHQEQVTDFVTAGGSSFGVPALNTLEMSITFERVDFGPRPECNVRTRFNTGDQISRHGFLKARSPDRKKNMLRESGKVQGRLAG